MQETVVVIQLQTIPHVVRHRVRESHLSSSPARGCRAEIEPAYDRVPESKHKSIVNVVGDIFMTELVWARDSMRRYDVGGRGYMCFH